MIAIFFSTMVNIEGGQTVSAIMIFVLSCVGLFFAKPNEYAIKHEKYWILSLLFFFLLIFKDSLMGISGWSAIDTSSRLILFIPLYFYIKRVGLDLRIIAIGATIGLILAGLMSYDALASGSYYFLGTTNHHTVFGQICLLLVVVAVSLWKKDNHILLNALIVLSFFMGLYAVAASGGRGGWIALPTIILYVLISNKYIKTTTLKIFFSLSIVAMFTFVYLAPNLPVKDRVEQAFTNTQKYFTEDKVDSSSGARLEMFKAAIIMGMDNLLIGVGEGKYPEHVRGLSSDGIVDPFIERYDEPHNQYLNSFAEQGFPGLISFLLLLLIPLMSFKKYYTNPAAKMGILITICYLDFALTMPVFEIQSTSLFYAIIIPTLLALTSRTQPK